MIFPNLIMFSNHFIITFYEYQAVVWWNTVPTMHCLHWCCISVKDTLMWIHMRGVCVVYKHFREIDRYLSYPIAFLWSIDNSILVIYFYIYHLKYWPVLWATIAGFCVLRHWYVVTGFRQYMNASSSTTHVKCVIDVVFFIQSEFEYNLYDMLPDI